MCHRRLKFTTLFRSVKSQKSIPCSGTKSVNNIYSSGVTSPSLDQMYCIVLYCIVLYCIVLYCIVLYCIVLYCIVLYCIVLYCIVLYCIVLYCIVLYCIVLYCIVWLKYSARSEFWGVASRVPNLQASLPPKYLR